MVGRHQPSEKDPEPTVYRMKLWSTNAIRARSKFWFFLRKLKKVKKAVGEVIAVNEIFEKFPTARGVHARRRPAAAPGARVGTRARRDSGGVAAAALTLCGGRRGSRARAGRGGLARPGGRAARALASTTRRRRRCVRRSHCALAVR